VTETKEKRRVEKICFVASSLKLDFFGDLADRLFLSFDETDDYSVLEKLVAILNHNGNEKLIRRPEIANYKNGGGATASSTTSSTWYKPENAFADGRTYWLSDDVVDKGECHGQADHVKK
jgi:hypothetical protein